MADAALWINASAGAPSYTAAELRQAMALGVMYDGRLLGGRQGVRPGGNQLRVTLVGSTITVQAGVGVLDPALTTPQGPYWYAIPASETHTLTAAHATNPRKDIVIARVYDHDEDASGLRLARTEYIAGTPNPAPVEPAIPAGADRLATIDVPASPGAASVTDRRRYTVAPGGIVPVSAAAEISAAVEGRYRDRLDTNVLQRDSGAAWETVADPNMFKAWTAYVPAWTSSGTPPAIGNGTAEGRYLIVGKIGIATGRLAFGSTTTFGTGTYDISVPFSVFHNDLNPGAVALVGGTPVPGIARFNAANTLRIYGPTGGQISATVPFTWANGHQIQYTIVGEVA
jgi:hypothetical protein